MQKIPLFLVSKDKGGDLILHIHRGALFLLTNKGREGGNQQDQNPYGQIK